MSSLCVQCGKEPVSAFKGYAVANLCRFCGIKRGEERKAAGEQAWKVDNTRKKKESRERRESAINEVSPGTVEKVRERGGKRVNKVVKKLRKDDYTWIPPHMLWCALNPVLTIHDGMMEDEDREAEARYIQKHGPPSQLAANLYKMLKGNEKQLERFFSKIDTLYANHIKKRESQDRLDDVKLIEDEWKIIEAALPIDGVVAMARRKKWLPARRENNK